MRKFKILFPFVPNETCKQLADISRYTLESLNTCNAQFYYVEVCFIDQNSKPLNIEGKLTLTIN